MQSQPLLFAHKGLPGGAIVRNTLPSLKEAFAQGADGVEFDVVKTKSGHLVVMSDTNLAASTNCKGSTEDWDYFELRAKCKTKDGTTIPNLYEALMVVRDTGGKLMLHVKINPDRKAAASIMDALNKYGLNRNGHATIFAFHPPMLDMLRAEGAARLGLIFNNTTTKHWKTRKYQALVPYNTPITQALIREAQNDGVEVYPVETYGEFPYTVEEGMAMKADGMILDSLAKAAGLSKPAA
ncbi:MAG: glycerophosphodiester phosphodiesterase [Sporichthyaceae bacterium]